VAQWRHRRTYLTGGTAVNEDDVKISCVSAQISAYRIPTRNDKLVALNSLLGLVSMQSRSMLHSSHKVWSMSSTELMSYPTDLSSVVFWKCVQSSRDPCQES
jgi:hypothetical protein